MIYVVLGVGFSGTTLVSELMHHSGIRMIDEDNDYYDQGGKYEHPIFQQINKDILSLTDDQVFHLRISDCPEKLKKTQLDNMLSIVEQQKKSYQVWGFKDPRTAVTYPLWRGLLPPHKIVAIYRHPASNWPRTRWRGLRKRYSNAWRAFIHLRQWYEYNEAVLTMGSNFGEDFILLNYEKLMQTEEEFDRFSTFLGRPLEDKRKTGMFRSCSRGDMLFRSVQWLMKFGSYSPIRMLKRLEHTHAAQCRVFQSKSNMTADNDVK